MLAGILGIMSGVAIMGYKGAPLLLWIGFVLGALVVLPAPPWATVTMALLAVVLTVPALRRTLVTSLVLRAIRMLDMIPRISDTERVALEAGNTWIETEYFSGRPDLDRLRSQPYPRLSPEELAFLDGPVEELCRRVDDWKIWCDGDLDASLWDFLRREGFFGMIIPREYGGLGFSHAAHSEVVMKIGSRSVPVCISTMVPNSLGPAELLIHYGTEEQKSHYLPRLAKGIDMPAFALTEPKAGSDAASIQSTGIVFRGEDGRLYLRLEWEKRFITLAAVATLLGLAFQMKDPDNLLGRGEDVGITCALVPTHLPGVVLGRRHDALGVPFYNCPTRGRDVVVPIESIIGGIERAGHGWMMLMECLAAGRGVSLPAQCTGGAKRILRVAGAHAAVRHQFGSSIGRFEGVAEPLARIGGLTYLLEAGRRYTLGALELGVKPPVVTAIAKYNFTELARLLVNDCMDVMGGSGISRGPRNPIAAWHASAPIGITVEGANIVTRSLIIFGQGALRAHPVAFQEVQAIESGDLQSFDRLFCQHLGLIVRSAFRALLLGATRGYLAGTPGTTAVTAPYYRKISWASAIFALLTDLAMLGMGGRLKSREKLSGRFADVLSWLYLATATLRRFEAEGERVEDRPFLDWSIQYAFWRIQEALDGIYANFDVPVLATILAGPVRFLHRLNPLGAAPCDVLGAEVAARIQVDGDQRDRLSAGVYQPEDPTDPQSLLERAFRLAARSGDTLERIRLAVREGRLPRRTPAEDLADAALVLGLITDGEREALRQSEAARDDALQVDSFTQEEYRGRAGTSVRTPVSLLRVASSNEMRTPMEA